MKEVLPGCILTSFFYGGNMKQRGLNQLIKTALMGVIAFIIMLIEFPTGIFPPFMKFDFSDVVSVVTGLALGPFYGVLSVLIKNVLHIIFRNETGGVGELANFIVGSAFVLPTSIYYARHKNKKSAIIGLLMGIICMGIVAVIANYTFILPFYSTFIPLDQIIELAASSISFVKDVSSYLIYVVAPFNFLKGLITMVITLMIYKKVSPLLHQS